MKSTRISIIEVNYLQKTLLISEHFRIIISKILVYNEDFVKNKKQQPDQIGRSAQMVGAFTQPGP